MIADQHTDREWLSSRDVADLFNVSPKTVIRWARAGLLLPYRRTLGGRYQFPASVVGRMLSFAPATKGPVAGANAKRPVVHVRGGWDPTENHRVCAGCGAVWEGGRGGCQAIEVRDFATIELAEEAMRS